MIISAARKANKDKRAEKRLYAIELRAAGKSAAEVAKATGFHPAYITQLSAKYHKGGIEAIAGTTMAGITRIWIMRQKPRDWSHIGRRRGKVRAWKYRR